MRYNTLAGYYTPSFFKITIQSFDDLGSLQMLYDKAFENKGDITEQERITRIFSTYFHEYFHFVQDITSYFGLNSGWNLFNQLHTVVNFCRKRNAPIYVPIDKGDLPKIEFEYRVYNAVLGDITLPGANRFDINYVKCKDLSISALSETIEGPAAHIEHFLNLELSFADKLDLRYQFGAIAVLETMVHLLQIKYFPTRHPVLPYKSGIVLCNYILGENALSDEELFCICDVSLMSPYPGITFSEILIEIKDHRIKYTTSQELMDKAMEYVETKWDSKSKFIKAGDAIKGIISNLSGHEYFEDTVLWFNAVITNAVNYRVNNKYFMLDIFRSPVPFGGTLTDIFLNVGSPEFRNLDKHRWIHVPHGVPDKDNVFPGFLDVLSSILNLFLLGNDHKSCELYDYCKNSKTPTPWGDDCLNKPWVQSQKDTLCPYGAYWRYWELQGRQVI